MTNNKQQTAVEWLFGQIPGACKSSKGAHDALEQAKEMEKERLTDAYHDGKNNGMDISHPWSKTKEISAEEWYNETYGEQ
jgi:hypothetical protein